MTITAEQLAGLLGSLEAAVESPAIAALSVVELRQLGDIQESVRLRMIFTRQDERDAQEAEELEKVDTTIGVGNYVRSYDFEGREDCYIEGFVNEIVKFGLGQCDSYRIPVGKRVFAGKEVERGGEVFPPVNGTPKMLGGVTNFVIRTADLKVSA